MFNKCFQDEFGMSLSTYTYSEAYWRNSGYIIKRSSCTILICTTICCTHPIDQLKINIAKNLKPGRLIVLFSCPKFNKL